MANKSQPSSLSIISAAVFIVLLVVLAIFAGHKKADNKVTPDKPATTTQTNYTLNLTNGISTGPADAKVTFTEFFDFECPACQALASEILPTLEKEYAGKVNFVFKMFPLPQHEFAKPAASAAVCAADQGKYEAYRDLLVKNYDTWTKGSSDNFEQYAKDTKLDLTKFKTCRDSKQVSDFIEQSFQEGVKKGIQATPTVYINDVKYEGVESVSFYEDKINALLNK